MTTEWLPLVGAGSAVLFLLILFVEGARRPGYDPVYHTGSELELGEGGWVQRANFFLMGAGMFAFAAGVQRTLDSTAGAVLVAVFGFGLVVAGIFAPDPVRGYPPGAPIDPSAEPSWKAKVHHVIGGPIAFFAIFGACLFLAGPLEGGWQLYTLITAGVGSLLTVSTAVAFQTDAARTGLVQRALILVYWAWIIALALHLAIGVDR